MREHSGAEGQNNNRNPTLKEQEAARGRSGAAIHGDRKIKAEPSRKGTAKPD